MTEEGIFSESKPRIREVEWDGEDSDFDFYDKSEGKPLHVDIDKETTEGNKSTLTVLPNRSEENKTVTITERHRMGMVILV